MLFFLSFGLGASSYSDALQELMVLCAAVWKGQKWGKV